MYECMYDEDVCMYLGMNVCIYDVDNDDTDDDDDDDDDD